MHLNESDSVFEVCFCFGKQTACQENAVSNGLFQLWQEVELKPGIQENDAKTI